MAKGSGTHNLGSVKMNFLAESSTFTKEVFKNESRLTKFANSAKSTFKKMGASLRKALNVKTLIATLVGTAGFGALSRSTVKYSSDLVEASRVAGMSITNFEKLREVLKGDGMAMEEATSATRRFAKRIGEARLINQGTFMKNVDNMIKHHEALGKTGFGQDLLDTIMDKSKGPLEVMQEMVRLSNEAGLNAEEIAALFDLGLGLQGRKMGITLVNAAKEHGDDLDAAMDHYGRFLTLTAEEHIKNKGLGQEFEYLSTNVKDAVRKVMSNISEPLSEVINDFNDWLLKIKNDPEALSAWVESFKEIMRSAKDTAIAVAEIVKTIADALDAWQGFWADKPDVDHKSYKAHPRSNQLEPRDRPKTPTTPSKPYVNPLEGLSDSSASYMPVSEQVAAGMAASSMVAGIGSNMIAPAMPDWMNKTQADVVSSGGLSNVASSMSGSSGSSAWSMDGVIQQFADLRPTVEELNSSFRNMINAFIDGESSFKDTMRGFLDSIIQRSLVDPAADWMSKGVDAFFGGLLSGGKADGGLARGLTLVGERGPEIVDFNKPGMVYSNEQLSAAMSGNRGTTVINYNISSTDGPGVRAALTEATPAIVEAAQARVGEEAERPGGFRRMIRGGI